MRAGPDPQQRMNRMSEILLAHDPPATMALALETSLQKLRSHYEKDPKAAHALVGVGEKKRDGSIPEPELAAWTMVASEMLNLDRDRLTNSRGPL